MMSYEQIAADSRRATARSRRASRSPKQFTGLGHDAIRAEIRSIPFLGDYVAPRFQRVDAPDAPRGMACKPGYLFVDSSGFGRDDEPALSVQQFVDYIYAHRELGYGIVEVGQFQVVIATYERKAEVRG